MRERRLGARGKEWRGPERRTFSVPTLAYNELKRAHQNTVALLLRASGVREPITTPIRPSFEYHEPDRHRDPDGVASGARKIILDALVAIAAIPKDTHQFVAGFGAESFFFPGDAGYQGAGVAVLIELRRVWLPGRLPDFNELRAAVELGVRRQIRREQS